MGTTGPRLEAQVRELGLEAVVAILQAVPRRDVPRFYSLAGAAVFPSIGDDAFPNSVVEAMACGVPVVATPSGGIPEAVAQEETGLLVSPRDAQGIADALLRLWADPAAGRAMGEKGRLRAVERFDWSRLTEELLVVLEGKHRA